MNNNFGLQENFDIELKKSEPIEGLTFKGVMEVVHKRDNEILSIDTGENVITNSGKAELVRLMGKKVLDTAVPGDVAQPMAFHYIGIGRRGDQSASATDTMLGGSLTNGFANTKLAQEDATGSLGNYYVSDNAIHGYEYNKAFVKSGDGGTSVTPRQEGTTDGSDTTATGTGGNFYHAHSESGTTIAYDTFLWYAKFVFDHIKDNSPVYTPDGGGATVTVNEAGIFNRPHTYGITTAVPMPVMLARRTFSDKPVKNNDELTIKWQITIK